MTKDNISLEPLFNDGNALGEGAKVTSIAEIGAVSNRAAAPVTDARQEITIGAGKNSIEIENSGGKIIYYGGNGVTSANGVRLFPNRIKIFTKVKGDFSIFLVCATGETSARRIAEYK